MSAVITWTSWGAIVVLLAVLVVRIRVDDRRDEVERQRARAEFARRQARAGARTFTTRGRSVTANHKEAPAQLDTARRQTAGVNCDAPKHG